MALKQAGELAPTPSMLNQYRKPSTARKSTTTNKLLEYAQIDDSRADPTTQEALRLTDLKSLRDRPLNSNTAAVICTTIKDAKMDVCPA